MSRSPAATPALIVATIAVSFSAIFIRIAGDDAATIVWARMAFAVVLLLPFALRRTPGPSLRRRHIALVLLSGVLLAAHFLLWTASLAYTSVAASVVLVSMHPVFVAPLGRRALGERAGLRVYAGVALALAGTVITCAGDVRIDTRALLGDLMALGGAAALAGYLLIGRGVRSSMSVPRYSAIAYAVVAVAAALAGVAGGHAHLPGTRAVLCCLALAVVCTIGGHTVYNWALRRVNAIVVSVAFLGEAPVAALLAAVLLAAVPPVTTVVGGVAVIAGLALTLAPRRRLLTDA